VNDKADERDLYKVIQNAQEKNYNKARVLKLLE